MTPPPLPPGVEGHPVAPDIHTACIDEPERDGWSAKVCSKCHQPGEFGPEPRSRDGLRSSCRACDRAYRAANKDRYLAVARAWREANREHKIATAKAWRKANPERVIASGRAWREANPERALRTNRAHQLRQYGLTLQMYEAKLAAQGGRCAACGSDDPNNRGGTFVVDHDHACCPGHKQSCGRCVRGLICNGCNAALGHVHDDVGRLSSLIAYLQRSEVTS